MLKQMIPHGNLQKDVYEAYFKNMGGSVMVTADSAEYLALEATKPEGCELLTIEEAVLQCL